MKKIIYTKNAPEPIGPYNQAIIAGNTLYVSGQIAIDPATGIFQSGDVESETIQVMKNMYAILHEAGADFSNVVKCSIFVRDINDFAKVNTIYAEYFRNDSPARETVEVSGLPKDAKVEISCIAVL